MIINNRLPLLLSLYLFTFLYNISFAQSSSDHWVLISAADVNKIYIDQSSLISLNEDLYAWVKEYFSKPIDQEGVQEEIHSSKTYYLFNKESNRYSILQVIYFDTWGNVLKSYKYDRTNEIPEIKYSSPIIKNSSEEEILLKCLELLPK